MDLTFTGCNFFRQRLILSILSGKSIKIKNIRHLSQEPGIADFENSFLQLIDKITDGSVITVNETGTTLIFTPGILIGGKLDHVCSLQRSISYYLEALLILGPFCKESLHITLKGITNDDVDNSVDALKYSSLPVLKHFILNDESLEIKIIARGLPPGGGGEVLFRCPVVNNIRPLKCLDAGKIKKIRGYAYSVRVSPAMASRMVAVSKGALLKFLPDVFIYTENYKGKNSGKSPGYGLVLVAETTTGVIYCAEAISNPTGSKNFLAPEDVAKQACHALFEEIYRGGCFDSISQSLACILIALGSTDVSKIKTGPLSPYTIQFLRHMDDFLQVKMKLETENNKELKVGTHKVDITCVGIGFTNISRCVQ